MVHLLGNGLQPPIFSSKLCDWENILVEEFCQPRGQEKYQNSVDHTIYISLSSRPNCLLQVVGDRRQNRLSSKSDLFIAPAGLPFFYQWEED